MSTPELPVVRDETGDETGLGHEIGYQAPASSLLAVGPNLGHALLLLVVMVVLVLGGQFASLFAVQQTHIYGHLSIRDLADRLKTDPRWLVPTEALSYALVVLVTVPLFRAVWQQPFGVGLHWQGRVAARYGGRLMVLGLVCGFGIGLLGTHLPMPKDPPIMADMMQSPAGAWMMFVFGVTGAPLFEEMVFRGFLLPAFVNAFRWLTRKGDLPPGMAAWIGVPCSVVLTSLPFALLHGQQVSHAWAPVFLIGLVSLVLCVVRLRLDSLACSTVVHAAYNFTLFAGILIQTGGFRHLDRLSH